MRAWLQIFLEMTIFYHSLHHRTDSRHPERSEGSPATCWRSLAALGMTWCFLYGLADAYAPPPPPTCFQHLQFKKTFPAFLAAPAKPMTARLDWISKQFLGVPYQLFVLGEGQSGEVDQCPLYRFDSVDCETFVTTVLALALSHDLLGYQSQLKQLRYQQGKVSFLTRNHFTSIDWNRGAHRLGVLQDITMTFKNKAGKPVFKLSKTMIDKPSWYRHLSIERVRLLHATPAARMKHLQAIKQQGQTQVSVYSQLTYIPLTALFNQAGRPNVFLFKQIPSGAVIEIVRPNWALKNKIGTNLDVSHLGFAFWHDGQLWFRNASLEKKQVVDQPLIEYLAAAREVPSIGGIHVERLAL
ncbi:MAG: DUF1460 domain-containing protein [Gammaproteobacteria bacterium]|nr:DUF1460 domain-containing protein [Gammaproteobacteria bacterium]